MDATAKINITSFIEQSNLKNIDHVLDQLVCDTDEECLLKEYLTHTSFRNHEPSRMYLFLMLCNFFSGKMPLKSVRWKYFLQSTGFSRLVDAHLNFKLSPDEFVDEVFKLWIISPDTSSILRHQCKT